MKTLVAVITLLALAAPAYSASGSNWECGGNKTITGWKGQYSVSVPVTDKGAFNVQWNNGRFWINGRECVELNDKLILIIGCADDGDYVCEDLAKGWEMTPAQVKRAINRWKTTWPGNTIKHH